MNRLFGVSVLMAAVLTAGLQMVGCGEDKDKDKDSDSVGEVESESSIVGQETPRALIAKLQKALRERDRKAYVECWGGNSKAVLEAAGAGSDMRAVLYKLKAAILEKFGQEGWDRFSAQIVHPDVEPVDDPQWAATRRIEMSGDSKAVWYSADELERGEPIARDGKVWYFEWWSSNAPADIRDMVVGMRKKFEPMLEAANRPGSTIDDVISAN